jgi:hypothetical protein
MEGEALNSIFYFNTSVFGKDDVPATLVKT